MIEFDCVVNLRSARYDVYIGRAGHGHDGYFGNPIRLSSRCQECGLVHHTAAEVLPCYEVYARRRLKRDTVFRSRVAELRGKVLGCFCRPGPCHGDVLVRLTEELSR